MKYILSAKQMQNCDASTMEAGYGIPSAVLMERAALASAQEIKAACPDPKYRVLIACGVGNNGGDGLAIARLLYLDGYDVTVLFPGKEEKCSEECARQLDIIRKYIAEEQSAGAEGKMEAPAARLRIERELPSLDFDIIADALFGIGLTRDIGGNYRDIIEALNQKTGFKVAVDIPSGISADTGKVMGVAFSADLTVTFGFAKIGQILYPGADYCGKLLVKDMGIDMQSLQLSLRSFALSEKDLSPVRMAESEDLCALPRRRSDSNKGTYGKLLVFAGSYNMAGAAAFSAKAAYRSGAGLVRVATDSKNREIIQTLVPEAILATYDARTDMASFVSEQIEWADAIVLGPGIGQSKQSEEMVRSVLAAAQVPCLVDADGLNILSRHPDWIDIRADLIVTPHPGEMARLLGTSVGEVKDDLIGAARRFTETYGTVTVLKDARTVICVPYSCPQEQHFSGSGIWVNTTGNNGMATAGSGDVLTGIIGALLGEGLPADQAAVLGVMIHGMAGDAAASVIGRTSLMATDLTDALCNIFREGSMT